ncbi:hypothetical protein KKF84_05560 [Myxococcota bacterium]|nr:hypothetical protein [Myxococcota bacterium]MBU1534765.1 hypothetical protein [Myxococcota bacterium]
MKHFRSSLLFFVLLVATLAWSPDADAISRNGARNLRSVKSTISIAGLKVVKAYESGPVTRRVTSHYDNLKRNLDRAVRTYNRIRGRDLRDPEVVKVGNVLRALMAHYNILKQRVESQGKVSAGHKNLHFAFKKLYANHNYFSVIQVLNTLKYSPAINSLAFMLNAGRAHKVNRKRGKRHKARWRDKDTAGDVPVSGAFTQFKANIETLKTACNGRFKGIQNHRHYSLSLNTKFGTWCMLVNESDDLIAAGIKTAVNATLKGAMSQLDDAIDSIQNKHGFISTRVANWILHPAEYRNTLKAKIASYSAIAGVPLNDRVVLSKWDSTIAAAAIILNKGAKKHTMKKSGYKHSYGKVERMVKKGMRSWKKGGAYKNCRMVRSGWVILKNRLTSLPISRTKGGAVLYKRRGEKWCRLSTFEYTEPYLGGGRYARLGTISWSENVRIQRCK